MTATADFDSVTTTDAEPTTLPHKISALPTWDTAATAFTIDDTEGSLCCSEDLDCRGDLCCGDAENGGCIRVVRMMFDGADRAAGERLYHAGMMCGLDVCDGADPGNVPLRMPQGNQLTHDIAYADTGAPPDGDYDVSVYGYSSNSGTWSR